MNSFKEMYVSELLEARSLEVQLTKALPGIIEEATDADLKQVLQDHLSKTQTHMEQVNEILQRHDASADEHKDQSMERLVSETCKWVGMIEDEDLRDAGIIASAQRMLYYEMAVYRTLSAWAKQLGLGDDEETLRAVSAQERAVDKELTKLAEREINPSAA